MRVYVPATMTSLAELHRAGRLEASSATAATPDLQLALPGMDDEELELEALLDAAELSFARLADDPAAPRRRVVLAADVPDGSATPTPDQGTAAVRLALPLTLDQVASVHVDEPAAVAAVAAGALEDVDLLWYAPEEIATLVGE